MGVYFLFCTGSGCYSARNNLLNVLNISSSKIIQEVYMYMQTDTSWSICLDTRFEELAHAIINNFVSHVMARDWELQLNICFPASLHVHQWRWNQQGVGVEVPTPPHFHWRSRWPCIFSFKRCLCEWKKKKKKKEKVEGRNCTRAADCAYWAAGLMWSAAPPIQAINSSPITPGWLFNFPWQEPLLLDSQRSFFGVQILKDKLAVSELWPI